MTITVGEPAVEAAWVRLRLEDEIVVEPPADETLREVEAKRLRKALPRAAKSDELTVAGKTWPVRVRLPDDDKVAEAAPEPTIKEVETKTLRKAKEVEPRSAPLLEPGKKPPLERTAPLADSVVEAEPTPPRTK